VWAAVFLWGELSEIEYFDYICGKIKKDNTMVIEIDKTVTPTRLKQSLKSMKAARTTAPRPNLLEFFGALPHIGDGLEFQKTVRNE
jgi:hypothetical protein